MESVACLTAEDGVQQDRNVNRQDQSHDQSGQALPCEARPYDTVKCTHAHRKGIVKKLFERVFETRSCAPPRSLQQL